MLGVSKTMGNFSGGSCDVERDIIPQGALERQASMSVRFADGSVHNMGTTMHGLRLQTEF